LGAFFKKTFIPLTLARYEVIETIAPRWLCTISHPTRTRLSNGYRLTQSTGGDLSWVSGRMNVNFRSLKLQFILAVNVSDLRCQLLLFQNVSSNFFPAEVTHSWGKYSTRLALVCSSRLHQEKPVLWPKYLKYVKSAKIYQNISCICYLGLAYHNIPSCSVHNLLSESTTRCRQSLVLCSHNKLRHDKWKETHSSHHLLSCECRTLGLWKIKVV